MAFSIFGWHFGTWSKEEKLAFIWNEIQRYGDLRRDVAPGEHGQPPQYIRALMEYSIVDEMWAQNMDAFGQPSFTHTDLRLLIHVPFLAEVFRQIQCNSTQYFNSSTQLQCTPNANILDNRHLFERLIMVSGHVLPRDFQFGRDWPLHIVDKMVQYLEARLYDETTLQDAALIQKQRDFKAQYELIESTYARLALLLDTHFFEYDAGLMTSCRIPHQRRLQEKKKMLVSVEEQIRKNAESLTNMARERKAAEEGHKVVIQSLQDTSAALRREIEQLQSDLFAAKDKLERDHRDADASFVGLQSQMRLALENKASADGTLDVDVLRTLASKSDSQVSAHDSAAQEAGNAIEQMDEAIAEKEAELASKSIDLKIALLKSFEERPQAAQLRVELRDLRQKKTSLQREIQEHTQQLDTMWMLLCGYVSSMTATTARKPLQFQATSLNDAQGATAALDVTPGPEGRKRRGLD